MRHGQTPLNDVGHPLYPGEQLRGDTEFPLDATGQDQARQAARLLLNRGIIGIVASSLTRALDTAIIVSDVLGGLPISQDSSLDTWSLGLYSGAQVTPELDRQIEWYENHPDERPPGGETYNDFLNRIERALARYESLPGPLLLVTHGRILFSLEHVRSGRAIPVADDGPPPSSVIAVERGVPGYQVLKTATVETIIQEALRG